jgi:hypothetical protein
VAPIAFFLAAMIYQFLIIKWNQPAMVKIGIAIAATYLGMVVVQTLWVEQSEAWKSAPVTRRALHSKSRKRCCF